MQRYHILPPIFSLGPSIFPEYSRNIPTENLFHTLVEQKSELSSVKSGLRMRFSATFPHEISLAMRNQPSTQLISCLDIVDAKLNRKTARICSADSSKRLEYEDIPDFESRKDVKHPLYSAEYSGRFSNSSYILKDIPVRNIVPRPTSPPHVARSPCRPGNLHGDPPRPQAVQMDSPQAKMWSRRCSFCRTPDLLERADRLR